MRKPPLIEIIAENQSNVNKIAKNIAQQKETESVWTPFLFVFTKQI